MNLHNPDRQMPAANSTFANMAGEVQIETVVQIINFGAGRQFSVPNPPHRKSANR
jgi:hypothetical protein